jgi:hypothetical protein
MYGDECEILIGMRSKKEVKGAVVYFEEFFTVILEKNKNLRQGNWPSGGKNRMPTLC